MKLRERSSSCLCKCWYLLSLPLRWRHLSATREARPWRNLGATVEIEVVDSKKFLKGKGQSSGWCAPVLWMAPWRFFFASSQTLTTSTYRGGMPTYAAHAGASRRHGLAFSWPLAEKVNRVPFVPGGAAGPQHDVVVSTDQLQSIELDRATNPAQECRVWPAHLRKYKSFGKRRFRWCVDR